MYKATFVTSITCKKTLVAKFGYFEQNVIKAAIDSGWHDHLRSCVLVANTLNTCCEIIVHLYYVVHQNIL